MNEVVNGRYILQQKLGEGGMGIVYQAIDRLTGATIALKQINLNPTNHLFSHTDTTGELRLSLAREFQILASLRHPHIISVLDYGFDQNRNPYFTMTYLPQAQTILAYGQQCNLLQKVILLQQTLQALAYLHQRNILHRDLKPDNILIANGRLHLLDFGLSTFKGDSLKSGGTYIYLAPELWENQTYTQMADLYALGVIAYELLIGTHPFAPIDHELIERVLTQEPSLEQLPGPPPLAAVIGRLLAKKPQARYANAQATIAAFSTALNIESPTETAAIRDSYLQAATFVGREQEWQLLMQAWFNASQGQGNAWLIGGESGVGKSRLLDELRIQVLVQGGTVLIGQSRQTGGGPLHLWQEPVRHLLLSTEVDDLTASILQTVVPDIERLLNRKVMPLPPLTGEAEQHRLFGSIVRLFTQQTAPVLLILEDLHWAGDSLGVLPYLTRQIEEQSWLIVGNYRDDETPNLPQQLPRMQAIKLNRLSNTDIAALSKAMLGDIGQKPAIVSLLQKETEGNAFFLVEVVRALAEEAGHLWAIGDMSLPDSLLPQGIESVIQRRLTHVPSRSRPLLVLAAVAGRRLDLPLLTYLAGGVDLSEWLNQCATVAVLEVYDGQWRFAHDKLREGTLVQLNAYERAEAHKHVAQGIEHVYRDDLDQAAILAHHWREGGNETKERDYRYLAGKRAAARYAHNEAVSHLTRVLSLTSPHDIPYRYKLLLERESALDALGQRQVQANDLKQLTKLAIELNNPVYQAEVGLRQAKLASHVGDYATAWQVAQDSITLVKHIPEQIELVIEGHQIQAIALQKQGEFKAAKMRLEEGLILTRTATHPSLELKLLQTLVTIHWHLSDYAQAQAYLDQVVPLSQQADDLRIQSLTYFHLGTLATHYKADLMRSHNYYQQALTLIAKMGDRTLEGATLMNLGNVYKTVGMYKLAQGHFLQARNISREVGDLQREGLALFNLGFAYLEQKAYQQANKWLQQSLTLFQSLVHPLLQGVTLNKLGHTAMGQRLYTTAHNFYQQALAMNETIGGADFVIETHIGLAYLALLQNQLQTAQQYMEKVLTRLNTPKLNQNIVAMTTVYLWGYLVLRVLADEQANFMLQAGYDWVHTRATQLTDETWQHSYLENVPEHRLIMQWHNAVRHVASPS